LNSFDPDELEISAKEIAEGILEVSDFASGTNEENSSKLRALEFGVHAVDLVVCALEGGSFEPIDLIQQIAELFDAFKEASKDD